MPTGRETSEGGGVLSSADVRGAGTTEWANLIGIGPDHPLVSSEGTGPYLINGNYSRIVTTPAGQSGSASEGGLAAVPDGMGRDGLKHLDSWRDLFNFKGSPMPWLLLVALGVLFFAHASIQARAGAFGKNAAAGAAFG
jgi:hypothetical protein